MWNAVFLCRFRNLIRVWVTQILEYKHLLLGRKPAVIVRKIAGFCQQCCQFCTSFDAALQTSHCIFGSSATGEIHLRQFRKGRSRFCHLLSFRLMLSIVRYANIRNQDTPCQVFRALIMKCSGKRWAIIPPPGRNGIKARFHALCAGPCHEE